jgi:ketosteroid isomerase-like protein
MKRIVLMLALALIGLGAYTSSRLSYAQVEPKAAMRQDVADVLSKFTTAINAGDGTTAISLMSDKPGLTVVGDGDIVRGPDNIRASLNKLIAEHDKYEFALGALDTSNVNGLALCTGPYSLRIKGTQESLKVKGAITVLLEYQNKKRWAIVHIHRSIGEIE